MTPPPVSICVPTFNGAKYLAACLESIRAQTWLDFEVLIVDDCSTDATHAIAADIASRDKRFTVFRNARNLGLVGNWNRCVELARGEWLKFVFQDDLLKPDCLTRLIEAATAETVFIACSRDFEFEDQTPATLRDWYCANRNLIEQTWGASRYVSADEFCLATLPRVGANLIGEPTSVMLRREVFSRFGGFNADLVMSCDLEYWTRVATNCGFMWIADRLAVFRVHGGATSATNRRDRAFRMNVLDNLLILHQYAFDPRYAALRHAAESEAPSRDLRKIFCDKAAWAERRARHADPSVSNAGNTELDEWNLLASKYPLLRRSNASRIRGIVGRFSALARALSRR